jgi:hypothetical protein
MLLALAFLRFSGACPIRSEIVPGIGSNPVQAVFHARAWEAFIHIAPLSDRFRNVSLAFSEELYPAIPHLEPSQPVDRIFIVPPIWGKQETLAGLNLQTRFFRICRRPPPCNPVLRITKASERRSKNAANPE